MSSLWHQVRAEKHLLQSVVCAVGFLCSCRPWDHTADLARELGTLWLKCLAGILRFAGSLQQVEIGLDSGLLSVFSEACVLWGALRYSVGKEFCDQMNLRNLGRKTCETMVVA